MSRPYTQYKLALPEEILLSIEKPERYLGNELNAVRKDKAKTDIRFAMCFPDVYEIGMSHLGIQILYSMFNRREDTWCERVYSPWVDLDRIMREKKIPLFALESQDPVRDFDFLGITLQYELCYTNVLQILDLAGIPLHAEDRLRAGTGTLGGSSRAVCMKTGNKKTGEENCQDPGGKEHAEGCDAGGKERAEGCDAGGEALLGELPIVIGGGPCAYNPEPIAEFFDLFYIGEGETVYDDLLDLYKKCKNEGVSRREFLLRAALIPGIYVPLFYSPAYKEDGTLKSFTPDPDHPELPRRIRKQVVEDFSTAPYIDKPLVPYMRVTQDRVVLEIMRGCIRGCRFCQAGMIYRPNRVKDVEVLKKQASSLLLASGQDEITLSSLSSSDYPCLQELVTYLIDEFGKEQVNVALPSLRIDAFSLDVMSKVQDVSKSSLTFAPEAGSQRLRDVINKGLTEEDILHGAREAFRGGWNKVKLYFMLGQPTETEEDRKDIAHLAQKIADEYYEIPKEERNGKCTVSISTSFFVPKPFTPFQWAVMYDPGDYLGFASTVNHEVKAMKNHKSIRYNWHEAYVTVLEGLLARGDRRVARTIEAAYRRGAVFDAWSEYWDWKKWTDAMSETGCDLSFYNRRVRSGDELFPWDFIDCGVSKNFLLSEWKRATEEGTVTPNCRDNCNACGAMKYGCGICYDEEDGRKVPRKNRYAEWVVLEKQRLEKQKAEFAAEKAEREAVRAAEKAAAKAASAAEETSGAEEKAREASAEKAAAKAASERTAEEGAPEA